MTSTAVSTCQLRGRDSGQMEGSGWKGSTSKPPPSPLFNTPVFHPLEFVLHAQKGPGKPSNILASSSCSPGL